MAPFKSHLAEGGNGPCTPEADALLQYRNIAVLPAILSPGTQLPYSSLALTLAAVLLNGLLWTWLATGYALRGNLLAALRNE